MKLPRTTPGRHRLHTWPLTLLVLLLSLLLVAGCGDEEGGDGDGQDGADTTDGADTDTSTDGTGQTDVDAGDIADGGDDASDDGDTTDGDTTDGDTTDGDTSDPGDGDTADGADGDTSDGGDVEVDEPIGCGYGEILGRVCSPSGEDWLFGVQVTLTATNCDGSPFAAEVFTDEAGFYTIANVPSGIHTIHIETGSFSTEIPNISVEPNKTTDLTTATTKTCLDRRAAKIIVLTGVFDNFESLLSDLGLNHTLYEGDSADLSGNVNRNGQTLLAAPDGSALQDELLEYDILIINSGEWYRLFRDDSRAADVSRMRNNIQRFINSGKSIYVSDWAYYWVELAFPEMLDFYGDDAVEGSAYVGGLANGVTASVMSEQFQDALKESTSSPAVTSVDLDFDWGAWVIVEDVARSQATVHIEAPEVTTFGVGGEGETVQNVPLVISFQPTPTSGQFYFASFHASANENEMKRILKWLVFQL